MSRRGGGELWKRVPGRRSLVVLGLIFAVHGVVTVIWVCEDQTLRGFDTGPHVEASVQAYAVVRHHGLPGLWEVVRGEGAGLWPGAGYLPRIAVAELFGLSLRSLRLTNLLFVALLLASVYVLGCQLHSESAGLLAAALVMLYPAVYGESRQSGVDFQGAAVVALGLTLLLATRRLSRPLRGVWLGLGVGLGVLLRPQALFYLTAPALLLVVAALRGADRRARTRVLLTAGAAAAVAALVSAPWWFGRLSEIGSLYGQHVHAHDLSRAGVLWFYLRNLPWLLSFMLLVLWVASQLPMLPGRAGAPFRGGRPWPRPSLELTLVWTALISGLVLQCVVTVRSLRYMLPWAPLAAVLTGVGLASIRYRRVRRALATLGLSVATLTWLGDSFGAGPYNYGCTAAFADYVELRVTSGPPGDDPLVVMGDELGARLASRHGDGRGVVVRYVNNVVRDERRILFAWRISPALRVHLPLMRPTGDMFVMRAGDLLMVGGAAVPSLRDIPARQCYILQLDPAAAPPAPAGYEQPVTVRYRRELELDGYPARVTLWEASRCTPQLERLRWLRVSF